MRVPTSQTALTDPKEAPTMSIKLRLLAVLALSIAVTGAGWKWDPKHKSAEPVQSDSISTVT